MDCCGFKGQPDGLFLKSELQSGCRRLFDCFIMHPAKLRRKRTGTICFLTVCCDGCSCWSLLWCLLLQTWSIDGRLAQPGNVQPACLNHRHRRKCSCFLFPARTSILHIRPEYETMERIGAWPLWLDFALQCFKWPKEIGVIWVTLALMTSGTSLFPFLGSWSDRNV